MKLKDLTPEQIEEAKKIYTNKSMSWDDRMNALVTFFGRSERTVRKWCSEKLGFKEKIEIEPEILKTAKTKKHDKTKKRFLITSAQNATPINQSFFNNIKAYADFINAEILVIPFRYKNPTSVFTEQQENDDWWHKDVVSYLTLNRHNLNNSISVLSDVKIQPTASNPLQGLESMTGAHSCVVGHPRMELRTVPVMEGCRQKIMFTTGACTKNNYTDSKAGKKGEFHHSFGFSIIEIKDDDTFFFRQVSAKSNGEFIDLFFHVSDEKISLEENAEAIIMGDIHVRQCDPQVTDVTLNDLFKKLYPKKVFLHDIIDSESISHHNLHDPFYLHELELKGHNDLSKEVEEMISWLKPFEKYSTYIVKSNHDEHVDKFLATTDWRRMVNIKNAIPYMKYSLAKLEGQARNGIVPYIINLTYPNFKCLGHNDNVSVKGWLLSSHGHIGSNGSKGNLQQYSKLSTKAVIGHSHQIGRIAGAVSVGTSTHLRLNYNKGASAWINSHGIVNRLGKFQHIVFFKTEKGLEYTTLENKI